MSHIRAYLVLAMAAIVVPNNFAKGQATEKDTTKKEAQKRTVEEYFGGSIGSFETEEPSRVSKKNMSKNVIKQDSLKELIFSKDTTIVRRREVKSTSVKKRSVGGYVPEKNVGTKDFGPIGPVSDPESRSRVVKVIQEFPNGKTYICSGNLIDEKHVITAGHCMYNDERGGKASKVMVIPSYKEESNPYNDETEPYGISKYESVKVIDEYKSGENSDYDLAVIELIRPVGALLGWFGYGYDDSDDAGSSLFKSETFKSTGYPGGEGYPGDKMYEWEGTFDDVEAEQLWHQRHDTELGGMSGAGAYKKNDPNGGIIYGSLAKYKLFPSGYWMGYTRITSSKFNSIRSFRNRNTEEEDLAALRARTSESSIDVGGELEISFMVANVGKNSWNQNTEVSLSLVQDNSSKYPDFDTKNIDISLSSADQKNFTISTKIPEGVDPGSYDISLSILNNDDDGSNNTTFGWDKARNIEVTSAPNPNLTVDDITINGPDIPEPEEEIEIETTISETAGEPVGRVDLNYLVNGTKVGGDRTSDLGPNETDVETLNTTFESSGDYIISVEVDPSNEVEEADEGDNSLNTEVLVNTPPEIVDKIDNQNIEVGETFTKDLTNVFDDPDGQDLSFSASSDRPGVAKAKVSGSTLEVTGESEGGPATILYSASDDVAEEQNIFDVDVEKNDPPTAKDDSDQTTEGQSVTTDVLANDTDPEENLDESSVQVESGPSDGSATAKDDGTVKYTPNDGFTGEDSYTYTVADAQGARSGEATVTITVDEPANQAPTANDDSDQTTEGQSVTTDVLANDNDPDEDGLDAASVQVESGPSDGSASANSEGTITYTPDGGFAGTDSYTYTVADNNGARSGEATVTVEVNASGDLPPIAPVASSPQQAGSEFWIDVRVGGESKNVQNLNQIGFDLGFEQQRLSHVDDEAGGFLEEVQYTSNVDAGNGIVEVGVTRTDNEGRSGSGVVARVRMAVGQNVAGGTELSFSVQNVRAEDPSGNSIDLNPQGLDVTVRSGVTVWPGDMDDSGEVDQFDIFPLGDYWGETGPSRAEGEQGCEWRSATAQRQASGEAWDTEEAIHADANGDGEVDQFDVFCLGDNWGKTQSSEAAATASATASATGSAAGKGAAGKGNPSRTGRLVLEVSDGEGRAVWVRVKAQGAENLLGFGGELAYPAENWEVQRVEPAAWLGEDLLTQTHVEGEAGRVEIGISRKGTGRSGSGLLARLKLRPSAGAAAPSALLDEVQLVDPAGRTAGGATVDFQTEKSASREVPEQLVLKGGYPNPVRGSATIEYGIPDDRHVRLVVYDMLGRRVATLVDQRQRGGRKTAALDVSAEGISSGTYLLRLTAGGQVKTSRITVVR